MKHWLRWVEWLSQREDATALAAARIVSGSTIFVHLIIVGVTGVWTQAWVDQSFGGTRHTWTSGWFERLGGATPQNVRLFMALAAAAALLMTLGFLTRGAVFITWFLWRTLTDLNNLAGGSSDDLLVNGLFILIWADCGRALSIDQWLRKKKDPTASSEAPAWPRYVLIFQIALVYWTTGLQKISNTWWPWPFGSSDALWYILQDTNWTRWVYDAQMLRPFFRITQLATMATWCFEVGGPLLLLAFWYRHTRERPGRLRALFNRIDFRLWYLGIGFCIHIGIFMLMEVGPFFQSVLVCYACCVTPAEWRAALARLTPRR